jgi:N-methylhydantoinase A/oxoprolinase/acetone carboxylase beta subunit
MGDHVRLGVDVGGTFTDVGVARTGTTSLAHTRGRSRFATFDF